METGFMIATQKWTPNSRNSRGTVNPQHISIIKTDGCNIRNSEDIQGNKLTSYDKLAAFYQPLEIQAGSRS